MNFSFKTLLLCVLATGLSLGTYAQSEDKVKVDYTALPDYDNRPPVKQELGIPNGNKGNIRTQSGVARSNSASDELPDHWNNTLFKHFPPYFYQSGPSCMCSSFVGYIFTHELNSLRDLDGSNPDNQMAVFFSWLQTYMNTNKEDCEIYNGCPSATEYGGRTYSEDFGYTDWRTRNCGWMTGYDKWYHAMFNRAVGHYEFPDNLQKEKGREACKRWLYNHNGDTDFKSGGLCYVTLAATGVSSGKVASTPANDETGAVGKYYVEAWGDEINHAMTLAGWDDRIEFDLNGNGIYGEESADEKGAWIIVNSWGPWHNGGWSYVPYRYAGPIKKVSGGYFWNPYVTYVRKNYIPKRTFKIKMDYSHRSELYLFAGASADTSAKSPATLSPMAMFKDAGDGAEDKSGGAPEVPMLGNWIDGFHDEPMEFGYDLTDISSAFDITQPIKYFFKVRLDGGLGSGHIYNVSVMDYNLETEKGLEIPFNIDTIDISSANGTQYLISVVVPGETLNAPTNATLKDGKLTWDAPNKASLKLAKYYVYRNDVIIDSVGVNTRSYIPEELSGNFAITAAYAYKDKLVESKQSNLARLESAVPEGDNVTLTLNKGRLVIPNALPNKLNEGTIEFWIKPNTVGETNHQIGGSLNDKFFIKITASGQITAGWNTDDCVSTAAKAVKANTWSHVAMTVNANTMTLYVNGMKKGSVVCGNQSGIPALGDLIFGAGNDNVDAEIDELRIWNKARTQVEIYANKDNAIANPSNQMNLISYLPMNIIEFEGEKRIQEFPTGNHGYVEFCDVESNVNTTVLKGSSLKYQPQITLPDSIYAGQATLFTGSGSVKVDKWAWSTPDATVKTHSIQSPYVTFREAGTYKVSLTTLDCEGVEYTTEKEIKVVEGQLPVPNFDISALRQSTIEPISFINRTVGDGCSYVWSATNMPEQTSTNANMLFEKAGLYDVTLTATNSAGSASITKTVEIYEKHPSSNFNIAPNNIYLGETTYLEDKSTGKPDKWMWTLSNGKRYIQVDGQYSSLVPPAPGYYDVSLQTVNDAGANFYKKSRALCVSNADAKNGLNFFGNGEQLAIKRPFAANKSTFTIEWWMNPFKELGTGGISFGPIKGSCDQKGNYSLYYNDRLYYNSNGMFIMNQWHHYAITFSSGQFYFYRDGEQVGSLNATANYTTPDWPDIITFGLSDDALRACIDEMRIWDIALSKTQLHAVCNSPIENPASTSHLCAYYDFNQNTGDVIDRTGKGNDATRINFGPDGDAWTISPGVFTLDFGSSVTSYDVSSKYLTNYKAPFSCTSTQLNPSGRSSAYELETETNNSAWVFKSPKVDGNIINSVFVDTGRSDQLYASSYYGFNGLYNQRLYQTVTLPQGHYKFVVNSGQNWEPAKSRLVVSLGDSIVGNENIDDALTSCLLSNSQELEFDVVEDGTNVSLGIIYNLTSYSMGISSFKLYKIGSTTQIADNVSSTYDAVDKGVLDNISAERGAIRVVSNDPMELKVYNAEGKCVFNEYVSGSQRIKLEPGVYVANGKKIIVK